jgi:hypothetical protein
MARLCPYCGVKANFENVAIANGHWGPEENRIPSHIYVQKCPECGSLSVAVLASNDGSDSQSTIEPLVYPPPLHSAHEAIPSHIASDYISGMNCLGFAEFKAAAVMFRRALQ